MKRSASFLTGIFALTLLLTPYIAQAHVLKADGSIGAVVHIDPDDDPIVNQPSNFYFEFKDKQGKFQPSLCDCTATISENGKTVFTQPLFQNSTNPNLANASFSFTFPQRDVYQLKLEGKPFNAGDFQPFSLNYDIRVSRTANPTTSPSFFGLHFIHFVLILVVFLISVALTTREKLSRKP